MDGETVNFLQTWWGLVASIIGIATPPFFLGLYIGGRRQKNRQQQPPSEHLGKEQVKIHFRTKIQSIEERKSDLNEKIVSRGTSENEKEIYRNLITELDKQKRDLESTRDSIGL